MNKQTQWLSEVIAAINYLGGQAKLEEIYSNIKVRGYIDFSFYKDWKEHVRKQIYLHSSETDIFTGNLDDDTNLFYSIEGKGKNVWGLRNYKGLKNQIDNTKKQ